MKTSHFVRAALCTLAMSVPALAQSDFPTRPIRILVGFGPGGASDIAARIIAQKMGEELGQQVIVENRTGASTSIAGQAVAQSAPDGYTLFMAGNANAVNAVVGPKPPFNILTAFTPIGTAVTSPSLLVATPSSGIKKLKDIIDEAKAHPGKVTYASAGVAATSHLVGMLFANAEGINLTHIPYKGSSEAITDVLGGRVAIMFAPISTAIPLVKEGKLVPIAVTSEARDKQLPDTPTLNELSVNDINLDIWSGFVVPAGTPADRVAKLSKAMQTALKNSDLRTLLENRGMQVVTDSSPEAFVAHMKSDIAKLTPILADKDAEKR
jgi:tripartite-type tricarboxylate transporter receptor subunit TctC